MHASKRSGSNAVSCAARSCGVSIPTSRDGPPPAAANAPTSRSSRSPETCGTTSQPRGRPAQRGPSSASRCDAVPAPSPSPAACRRSPRRRGQRPARSVSGGHSRVFTRPGTGDFAMTIMVSSTARTPPSCRERPAPSRAPSRSPSTGPPAARTRCRRRRSASRPRRPAAPSRAGIRCVGRGCARSSRSVRRATRSGPRSFSGASIRRRTLHASTRFATRACSGHAAAVAGRRRATTRSARPPETIAAKSAITPGSMDASQSQNRDQIGRGRFEPGVAGGAVPSLRAIDHLVRRASGRCRPSRRSSRCRPRSHVHLPADGTGPRAAPPPRPGTAARHRSSRADPDGQHPHLGRGRARHLLTVQ